MRSDVQLSDDDSDSETGKDDDDNNVRKLQQQVCIGHLETWSVSISLITVCRDIKFYSSQTSLSGYCLIG